jgi:hypothetical protein
MTRLEYLNLGVVGQLAVNLQTQEFELCAAHTLDYQVCCFYLALLWGFRIVP